jgi:NAD(P)-dependent dehydrogenase (short-subunit alcohol dehydrogenase family)
VRINAVCPGLIETGMTKPVFDRAKERGKQDKIGQLNPLKRAGQPDGIVSCQRRGVPTSTARRSRWMAVSPRRCRMRGSRFDFRRAIPREVVMPRESARSGGTARSSARGGNRIHKPPHLALR